MSIDIDYIKQLKLDISVAPMIEDNLTKKYRIQIVNRGENLFYYDKKENRALIVPIEVRKKMKKSIFIKELKKWDNGNVITNGEKEVIFDRVNNYFYLYQEIEAFI